MDDELIEYIEELSEYLDEDGRAQFRDANYVETLVGLTISKLDFPHEQYKLSGKTFERNLRSKIGQINPDEDIEEEFTNLIGELKKQLGTNDPNEYSVVFPLSIKSSGNGTDVYCIENLEIEEITEDDWEECLGEAREDISFRASRINSPHSLSEGGSFWKTTISTLDSQFSIERTRFILKTFLAELNFLKYYGKVRFFEIPSSNPWPNTWSDIRMPNFFLVFQDREFIKSEFSEGTLPRKEVEISSDILNEMENLPKFSEKEEIDEHLISGLHFYLSGITNPSNNAAFLDFWRGLETLTLSEDGDSSSDITDRAASVIRNSNDELLLEQIDRVVDIRNNIVHGSTDMSVSQSDINVLKQFNDFLLSTCIEKRDSWSISDFEFVLHKCNIGDQHRLEQQREARQINLNKIEREIAILDELIEGAE